MKNDSYNPDVLSCIANLSNDEVFTPPSLANQILDMLPSEIWSNPNITFLDPVCKSGVFLREIAKRLMKGLEEQIPDKQSRINHIFSKQLFGIAITEMTALLSRRSVYCSKKANSKYSICGVFKDEQGNIRYNRMNHKWEKKKCVYCGASQDVYDRDDTLETYAYNFIHTNKPEELFNMKFDVIIGNPPYQLETGGAGRQAKPIYNLFVEQAKKLNPKYLVMIIPSRWFSGGMGLNSFRDIMINDRNIVKIVDFVNAKDCFPQNSISGGVCYFLRDRDNQSDCEFISINSGKIDKMIRPINEFPVLVRYNKAVSIVRKILNSNEKIIDEIISSLMPFGLSTNVRGSKSRINDELVLHSSNDITFINRDKIKNGFDLIDKYKVMISKTGAEHAGEPGKNGMFKILTSSLKVLKPGEVCTHSYFIIGKYHKQIKAENTLSYLKTKFVRFLILQSMNSINLSKLVFQFVPLQDFSESWTDEKLYAKYGLTEEEILFIESMIRPMDLSQNGDEDD
jgi:site-specific DNA-methyltransferase (adenine-specific)